MIIRLTSGRAADCREQLEPLLERAAAAAEVELYDFREDGRGFKLSIRNNRKRKWPRIAEARGITKSGWRRIGHFVCWHGHRAFMREVFKLVPNAIIRTLDATYEGSEDFEQHHGSTGRRPWGSMMSPYSYRQLCECEENDDCPMEEAS